MNYNISNEKRICKSIVTLKKKTLPQYKREKIEVENESCSLQ